jgi:hypothetical protein
MVSNKVRELLHLRDLTIRAKTLEPTTAAILPKVGSIVRCVAILTTRPSQVAPGWSVILAK